MRSYVALTLIAAGLIASGTARGEDDLSPPTARLFVTAPNGASGALVRGGIPFSRAMDVKDLSRYALWRPTTADRRKGEWVPVQWSVTSRHGGAVNDTTKPVRWATAQFPGFEGPYELRTDMPSGLAQPSAVAVEDARTVEVDTGAIRFTVPRDGRFGPLRGLQVRSADANGKAADRAVLADGPGMDVVMTLVDRAANGSVVDTTYKLSDTAISDVAVEENGPWRSVIRIRGKFQDKDGRPLLGNHLGYTIRLWADRGSDEIRVFFTLENNGVYGPPADQSRVTPKPQWIRVRELALVIPTALSGKTLHGTTADGSFDFQSGAEGDDFRLLQLHKVIDEKNEARNFAYTVRAGTGWRGVRAPGDTTAPAPTQFGSQVAAGTRSAGGLRIDDGSISISTAVRYFWQSYPKAISFDEGQLKVELWPREPGEKWPADLPTRWGDCYEFEGGRHKTYEVVLGFGMAGKSGVAKDQVASMERNFQAPPSLAIDPAYVAGANAVLGPFALPSASAPSLSLMEAQEHHARMQLGQVDVAYCDAQGSNGEIPPASLITQRETRGHALMAAPYNLDLYGYTNFGDLPHDLGYCYGHHDWVRGLFINWLRFGKREFLDIGTEMMRYRYDYAQYHCEDQQDPVWRWYNGFQRFEIGFHGARLGEFEPHGEATGCPQGTWLEGMLMAYAVTGDPRALETARENADAFVNYFTVSGVIDATFVRGAVDYFGQLSGMSLGVHQLMAFYEFTGERRYYDVAMQVFERGLLMAEEYYGNQGFFNVKLSQTQIWPVVRMLQPLISVHRMSGDPRALAMLIRILTFLTEQAYEGGEVDDQGLYMPLQLPYQWEIEDGRRVAKKWFIPYNFFTADAYAYAYMATQYEAETFLDMARATYRDATIFFQAPVHQAVPPGFYSAVSYSPRQYPNSETKNDAWLLNQGQWYLTMEQRLAAEGRQQDVAKVRYEDWFVVRRRSVETRASRHPVGWFGWNSLVGATSGASMPRPVRTVLEDVVPPAPGGTRSGASSAPVPTPSPTPTPTPTPSPTPSALPPVPPPPGRSGASAPPVPAAPGAANPVLPPIPDAPVPTTPVDTKGTIAMDDRDAVFAGDWSKVQADDANNGAYRQAEAGARNCSATYTIPVPVAGAYYLFARWPKVEGASSMSRVEVTAGSDWDRYFADQAKESGRWRLLCTVRDAGPTKPVLVRFSTDGADGKVLADAVELRPVTPPSIR